MKHSKKWEILNDLIITNKGLQIKDLLRVLLKNRGFATKNEQEAFLHGDLSQVTPKSVLLHKKQLDAAISRLGQAIEKKEQIIIFGDYDVDGICGTAILWESLHDLGANVLPYIPSRMEEGYGLSIAGIDNVLKDHPTISLIVTVDNGIVAHQAVSYANQKGIEIIITDHHVASASLPDALSIVHTTKLCGTSVAWMLAQALAKSHLVHLNKEKELPSDHLALVALATVADLVPLTGANRILLKAGLDVLRKTHRPGIIALCAEATIDQAKIGVYEIGHVIGPRLNAMGRIASGMDSLRLLCTKDRLRAKVLAEKLGLTNRERQDLTKQHAGHALSAAQDIAKGVLFIAHPSYEEGVIGLVAGKLVEAYSRPAIVASLGKKISKASARSVKGFNIIEFIRTGSHLLINAGGHPMAAGFTFYTEKREELEAFFAMKAQELFSEELATKTVYIDCALPLQFVSQEVYDGIQTLSPFGMGNFEPTFTAQAKIISIRQVGKERNHLSLQLVSSTLPISTVFPAIAFGMGEKANGLKEKDSVEIVYTIDENVWKDRRSLQLKIWDIRKK